MSANFASLVVSGNTALPRTTSSLVDRGRPRAGPGGIVAGSCEFRGPEGRATGSEIRTAKQPVVNRQPAIAGSDEFVINHKEKNPRSRSSEDLMLIREGKKLTV